MTNESPPKQDVKMVWQNQEQEALRMSAGDIRSKAVKYQRKIEWRNAREYIVALALVIFFGNEFVRTGDTLARVGFGLLIVSLLYVVWHLHRKGSWRGLPTEIGAASCLQFHRSELERQRQLVSSAWRWYLGPFVPGLAVVMAAVARANPHHLHHINVFVSGYAVVVVLAFIFIWKLNQRAARRLQRRIDELDALARET